MSNTGLPNADSASPSDPGHEKRSNELIATVLITSQDRKELLSQAIESVQRQTVPVEILVVDDGSTDGTLEHVRSNYPEINLIHNEQPLGIIAARNEAAKVARGDILFTLDDDATFGSEDVIESVIQDFCHPRVAVVAIPYTNHWPDGTTQPPKEITGRQDEDFPCCFNFPGGSNAMRRQVFLKLGGYGGSGRQAEEQTLAVRLLNQGYVIRHSSTAEIDHYPQRQFEDRGLRLYYGTRNALLYGTLYIPWRHLPNYYLTALLIRGKVAVKYGCMGSLLRGIATGTYDSLRLLKQRSAVSSQAYLLSRQLVKKSLPFSELRELTST